MPKLNIKGGYYPLIKELLVDDLIIIAIVYKKMNKKKLILSIVFSLFAVAVIIVSCVILKTQFTSKSDGEIQIVLVDLDGTITSDRRISFKEGYSLEKILKDNYENVVIENGMLMSIENFTTPSDWSTFISIYVDGKMSEVGLTDIKFEDGTKISFIKTEYVPY